MSFDQSGWTLVGSVYDVTRSESNSVSKSSNTVYNYDIFSQLLERSTKGVRLQWGPSEAENLLIYKESLGQECHSFLRDGLLGKMDNTFKTVYWAWDETFQCRVQGLDYTVLILDRINNSFQIFTWSNKENHYNFYSPLTKTWEPIAEGSIKVDRISLDSFINIYLSQIPPAKPEA